MINSLCGSTLLTKFNVNMISALYNGISHTMYLGEYGIKILVHGYVRAHAQKYNLRIPKELSNMICNINIFGIYDYLPVPFYPPLTIELGKSVQFQELDDSVSIYPKAVESISMKQNQCVVLGELQTHSAKRFEWSVKFKYHMQCCINDKYQMGCIIVPKNKENIKRFWNLIHAESGDDIGGLVKKYNDTSVSAWWFSNYHKEGKDQSSVFCLLEPNSEESVTHEVTVDTNGQLSVYVQISDNGDVNMDFRRHVKNCKLFREKFHQLYSCFWIIIIPTCICYRSYDYKCLSNFGTDCVPADWYEYRFDFVG